MGLIYVISKESVYVIVTCVTNLQSNIFWHKSYRKSNKKQQCIKILFHI